MLFLVHGAENTRLRFGGLRPARLCGARASLLTTMRVSSKDLCSSVAWATGAPALLAMCGHAVMSLAGSGDFGGPGPGQQRRMGEGYHGGAEQYQFSAATPTADTCFSGIPVGVFPRVEAGSVAHIGINDEVFSMEPPCALELRDFMDTRFVFSAQPRERLRRQ